MKKETAEHLDAFRRQREAAEKEARERVNRGEPEAAISSTDSWTKKRRRKDAGTGTSKLRKTSTSTSMGAPSKQELSGKGALLSKEDSPEMTSNTASERQKSVVSAERDTEPAGLGLGAYDSDDD